ncbi:tol protein [Thelonectria olida]|uniref:Tol protein n=1 Tax=Thelonectria olida TaxID=1576542 RepID=A0A9P8WHG9_9HYPO|nr:tol protein [Thelonectria olida]
MKYSKLCSTCERALQPDWEKEKRDSPQSPFRQHHASSASFLRAVSQKCFICWKIWKMILSGHVLNRDNQLPSWIEGSEAGWDNMSLMAQQDEDTSAILLLFACSKSKTHTSSPSTLSLISNWIRMCQRSHEPCQWRKGVAPWQPTRLLDIGRLNDKTFRLVSKSRKTDESHAYITLSYRWGPENQPRLLTSNINAFFEGSLIEKLPKTFRDAIVVARMLGVRYLWIDALCIIQDSQNDWECESAAMGSVYANALCNIAASASDGPDGGLFRRRDGDNLRLGCVRAAPLPETRAQTYHIIDSLYSQRQLRCAPLFRRGWVFQERMLAARVIYFAEEQVFWECCVEHKCEAFPAGIPFAGTSMDQLPQVVIKGAVGRQLECDSCAVFRQWNLLVQRYSECQLTRPSDKLSAFAGIASYFQLLLRANYIYGMWESRLIDQLGYVVEEPAAKQSLQYRAPSWSWASLDGPIMSPRVGELPFTHVKLEEGGVKLGQLRLRGSLTRATYSHPTPPRKSDIILEGGKVLNLIVLRDHLGIEFRKGKRITLLAFQSELRTGPYLGCFVLEPVLCAFPATTYRRIGFAHVFQSEPFNPHVVEGDKYDALGVMFGGDGLPTVDESRLSDMVIV